MRTTGPCYYKAEEFRQKLITSHCQVIQDGSNSTWSLRRDLLIFYAPNASVNQYGTNEKRKNNGDRWCNSSSMTSNANLEIFRDYKIVRSNSTVFLGERFLSLFYFIFLTQAFTYRRSDWTTREVANPKANRKSKIGEEDGIKHLGSVCLKWISRSVGQILYTAGYFLFKQRSGRGGNAEDEPEMIWQIGGSGVSLEYQRVWHGLTNASFIALENMLYFASYIYQKTRLFGESNKNMSQDQNKKIWKNILKTIFCHFRIFLNYSIFIYFFVLWYYYVEYGGGGVIPHCLTVSETVWYAFTYVSRKYGMFDLF